MTSRVHLLKNVRPIDFPGHDGSRILDVLIKDGIVAAIGGNLDAEANTGASTATEASAVAGTGVEQRDFAGAYLSPAWVDMHTHVYWGGSDIALRPATIGAATGAPILVDAGSAGEGNFLGFEEFIVKPAREKIIPFLNVGSIGLVATNRVPEVRLMSDIDIERTAATVEHYRDVIRGLKVRLCSIIHSDTDILPLKLAKKLSRWLKLPLMTHIGRPLPLVEEALDRMDAGDIVTHCFQGKPASSVVDDDRAFAALMAARDRGVVLDIGHGSASFSYRVARICLDRGVFPDTLGSDLHTGNINGPVWDLSIVISKLLSMGLPLPQCVAGVAGTPRRVLGLPPARLEKGAEAAFTLFAVEDCDLELPDSLGDRLRLRRRVFPRAILWRGELSDAASRL